MTTPGELLASKSRSKVWMVTECLGNINDWAQLESRYVMGALGTEDRGGRHVNMSGTRYVIMQPPCLFLPCVARVRLVGVENTGGIQGAGQ
jgi:hypothetical protein